MNKIKIGLAGNPNSGKTTLFNSITGAHQKVGNWSGVTVDIKTGKARIGDVPAEIVDLPGTYSLTAFSAEELVARDFIIRGGAQVMIDVVDATNLERNLYLALQIMEMNRPLVLAFNMSDELKGKGLNIDYRQLSTLLGVPIMPTVGRVDRGVKEVFALAVNIAQGTETLPVPAKVDYGEEIERELDSLSAVIDSLTFEKQGISSRWYALKLLEEDKEIKETLRKIPGSEQLFVCLEETVNKLKTHYREDLPTVITEKRYGVIHGAIRETVKHKPINRKDLSEQIDNVLTHRVWAYPIFALFMWILFQATFFIGGIFSGWLEELFQWLSGQVTAIMAPTWFRDLLVEGVIGGVGGVMVFLPNILILFLGISFLEDTGYMARIAFIMDKLMHRMGLHGKSFIPLLMGIGCSVPAIMAARTLESRKDRILTILVTPLITCSARLPVYILFAGAFFTKPGQAGNVIFILYLLSFVFAFGIGLLFRKTLFRGEDQPFVMELPPYRLPTGKSVLIHMWEKAKHYLQKMGGVVLVFSIALWFLSTYPKNPQLEQSYDTKIAEVQNQISTISNSALPAKEMKAQLENKKTEVRKLEFEKHSRIMQTTAIGRVGTAIEPVLRPAGFDWRFSVSLITGFVAKEIVVSSMGVLFNAGQESDAESESLRQALRRHYTPLQAVSFMLFILLYTPCVVALVTLIRELRSWKWSLFSVGYQLALAWIVAVITYQAGTLLNLGTKMVGG